ncbi:uncharacterized protein LOC129591474 isoform X2 [Paramacrobiotus metropolitanus]|uniref:uncharacterized protein LOC129591474 isoform X2 n=1 Tax=Paramacrobiotus metropolitanus TaxID=2943436 RepID=UPI0024461E06|nr:uncharacterized protein LOC129591474 isoform X2 [Paramacrobiotus metropolitanus]
MVPLEEADSMDYQETKRIQEDIDEMFSYLNGWLDEPDSEITEHELLSVSGGCQAGEPETELDRRSGSGSQSDDSAVCVGGGDGDGPEHEHSRSPTTDPGDTDPDGRSNNSLSPTREDDHPELASAPSDQLGVITPMIVKDPLITPIIHAPRPLLPSRNVDISTLNYIQLQFTPELASGNNKENWDVKDDEPHPSEASSLTEKEKLRTRDPLHVLYSQISKNKPKRSVHDGSRDNPGGRMQRIREQSPLGMRSPCFEPHFRQEEDVYATPYGCSEDALYTEPHITSVQKMSEGSIVRSLYPLSSAMPGTLSFMSGETGVLMRTNIGGWCYICMRDKEGWAPANYWQPLRSALRERMRARGNADRNEFLDDWYLGPISRPDSEFLLLQFGQEGDFLLRNSSIRAGEFTLSMRHGKQVHHFAIRRVPETGKFTIGSVNYQFTSLHNIIAHYRQHTILSDKYAVLRQAFAVQL